MPPIFVLTGAALKESQVKFGALNRCGVRGLVQAKFDVNLNCSMWNLVLMLQRLNILCAALEGDVLF